ncbi:uncharacterized protein LOC131018618 [Salvia miltiorrhiza]|uniref:uncharacterized protein LOC131018618 n=1 Tax=Salvia miltiorrhiza TaxID=226208 RepID=UPI0025AC70F9|nr:uncharacterized protein LOC131018618 [Salvia miltiorrhiza]
MVGIIEPKSAFNRASVPYWRAINLVPIHQNQRTDMCSNIWIFANPNLTFQIIFSSDQTVIIDCIWQGFDYRVAFVHGANSHQMRRQMWIDLLGYLNEYYVIIGDFNAVKGAHERISTCMPAAAACKDFCDFIDYSGLVESPTTGLRFTWSGRRFMPSHVESILDRAFYTASFADHWQSVHTHVFPRITSDHSPIALMCQQTNNIQRRFFKFLNMWTEHPEFSDLVTSSWTGTTAASCPIYTVMSKLKRLRKDITAWNRTVFGNVDRLVMETQQELLLIQEQIAQDGYTEELFNREVAAQATVNVHLSRKNSLLQQKSRVKWLHDGDRNTAFFHNMLRYKQRRQEILHLQVNGTMSYDQQMIEDHIVDFFSILFNAPDSDVGDITAIEAVIDHMVSDDQNLMLVRIPDDEEITAAVFDLDANSAAGPDGFTGKNFHVCWQTIKVDIWKAARAFFTRSYLPNGCNSNTLIMIPKKEDVTSVTDLRPIVLSNFFFKIISKILARRLNIVAEKCVSPNQFGFISGRAIHDCIMLGSEGVNCMNRSNGGRNMTCKIDISKAFDTLRWDFLLDVLRVGGYDSKFIRWIEVILHSAKLSILVNGKLCGYFSCSRGVRQGDPLFPILFGIAEDVLSALFHNCVSSDHLHPMKYNRRQSFPTHLLYADDILVFCKASVQNAKTLKKILDFYSSISGQQVSLAKSHVFYANKVDLRLQRKINRQLGFAIGTMPFTYLGVPIFVGRVKASYLRAIHDRIAAKFSRWKGLQLSMAGRLCLIKSVIQSSATHSMLVYRWPRSLIHNLDKLCRNFLWSGDVNKRGSCPVNWERVCSIKEEGGLGLKSFALMNKCYLMKMAWNIIRGKDFGYSLLKVRYLDNFSHARPNVSSSIWLGIHDEISPLVEDSYSFIGNGESTNFWKDDWIGYKLADRCAVPVLFLDSLNFTVADYFYDGVWHFTQNFVNNFPEVVCDILLLPIGTDSDTRFWKNSVHGQVTSALAFANNCHRFPQVTWGTWIWERFIPMRRSMVVWRVLHNRLPTYDSLIRHGLIKPNHCPFCFRNNESIDHIFWSCMLVRETWIEFLDWFNFGQSDHIPGIHNFLAIAWNLKHSSQVNSFWKAGIITFIWMIWVIRNDCVFENHTFSKFRLLRMVKVTFKEVDMFQNLGHMHNSWSDYLTLRHIGVKSRAAAPPLFRSVHWWPPVSPWIKVNTDGSAQGSPGNIAAGGVFRDHFAWVRGCFHYKAGVGYAFEAELLAVIIAVQIAHSKGSLIFTGKVINLRTSWQILLGLKAGGLMRSRTSKRLFGLIWDLTATHALFMANDLQEVLWCCLARASFQTPARWGLRSCFFGAGDGGVQGSSALTVAVWILLDLRGWRQSMRRVESLWDSVVSVIDILFFGVLSPIVCFLQRILTFSWHLSVNWFWFRSFHKHLLGDACQQTNRSFWSRRGVKRCSWWVSNAEENGVVWDWGVGGALSVPGCARRWGVVGRTSLDLRVWLLRKPRVESTCESVAPVIDVLILGVLAPVLWSSYMLSWQPPAFGLYWFGIFYKQLLGILVEGQQVAWSRHLWGFCFGQRSCLSGCSDMGMGDVPHWWVKQFVGVWCRDGMGCRRCFFSARVRSALGHRWSGSFGFLRLVFWTFSQ